MAEVKHELFLSTIDKEFYSTPIKVRNSDVDTQVLKVEISEYGKPKSFEGLKPFFCLMARKITGQGVSEEPVDVYNDVLGTLEYTMSANAFQMIGQNEAYFSFRKEMKNGEWTEQFSTRSFKYIVEESIHTIPFKDSNNFWTFTELYTRFKQYVSDSEKYGEEQKKNWEDFVEQNREIIESIDPSGKVLTELIDSRGSFDTLKKRLDYTDLILKQVTKYPILEYEKTYVVNPSLDYFDLRRYGIDENNSGTKNYEYMLNFIEIFLEGHEYFLHSSSEFYFEGEKGFVFNRAIHFTGKGNPKFVFNTQDGNALLFTARYTQLKNLEVSTMNFRLGTGIKFTPIENSGYLAYCSVEDVKSTGFNIAFYAGDIFEFSLKKCLGRNSNTGFRLANVTTMLNSQNCYALNCNNGHSYSKCYYATIINVAADNNEVSYIFDDMHSTTISGIGQEKNNGGIRINKSDMLISGLTSDGNNVASGFGTVISLSGGSKITLINAIERLVGSQTTANYSVIVNSTSSIAVENSKFLKDVYVENGGRLDGNFRVNDIERNYVRSKKVTWGSEPPTTGRREVGEIQYNNSISISENPVQGWMCIANGEPGSWRPFGFLPNKGPLSNRPTLSGFKHLGYKYIVLDTGVAAYEITFVGDYWIKNDGTKI